MEINIPMPATVEDFMKSLLETLFIFAFFISYPFAFWVIKHSNFLRGPFYVLNAKMSNGTVYVHREVEHAANLCHLPPAC